MGSQEEVGCQEEGSFQLEDDDESECGVHLGAVKITK